MNLKYFILIATSLLNISYGAYIRIDNAYYEFPGTGVNHPVENDLIQRICENQIGHVSACTFEVNTVAKLNGTRIRCADNLSVAKLTVEFSCIEQHRHTDGAAAADEIVGEIKSKTDNASANRDGIMKLSCTNQDDITKPSQYCYCRFDSKNFSACCLGTAVGLVSAVVKLASTQEFENLNLSAQKQQFMNVTSPSSTPTVSPGIS